MTIIKVNLTVMEDDEPEIPTVHASCTPVDSNVIDAQPTVDELNASIRTVKQQLSETTLAMKAAVDAENYTAASEYQAEISKYTAQLEELKTSLFTAIKCKRNLAREPGETLPRPAKHMRAEFETKWEENMKKSLAPMQPAIQTVLQIIHDGMNLAAEKGYAGVNIQLVIDRHPVTESVEDPVVCERRNRVLVPAKQTQLHVPEAVQYVVHMGFCTVPVGKDLTEAQVAEYARYLRVKCFGAKVDEVALAAEVNTMQVNGQLFDGEITHNFHDLNHVMCCDLARCYLMWNLSTSGYDVKITWSAQAANTLRSFQVTFGRSGWKIRDKPSVSGSHAGIYTLSATGEAKFYYNDRRNPSISPHKYRAFIEYMEDIVLGSADYTGGARGGLTYGFTKCTSFVEMCDQENA
uniref:Uncharacterized protein n=1 Tax=Pyramimonas obovata TaxID=1411642 RepID=A0A7S0N3I5_9CHLO|mmetsp:Transcript_19850/g.43427  ORF Transcript_19850/g.43427 Transcript_19850/m.43427 type:complete len:407 (+) Transcript_19850:74-1294(+)|eukprot:CAMPEP_0118958466 /NCGR_PEP_ID=MMETSP1169-20130426/62634_1 /TAXON_ID=36882 /ORGANISM="Pyramimonas obovata, Strain CCMP722" /LENGTH=406 /DNA_ID=CAMNT_0006906581 /DNA_START=50 /DNA_END=1270 /DNA_ORIENTATION=+